MGKTTQGLHLAAHLLLGDDPLCRCLLVDDSTLHPGKCLDRLGLSKGIHLCILHRDHHIPYVLIPFKIGLSSADLRKGEEALHDRKGQERGDKGQGCGPQGFSLGL